MLIVQDEQKFSTNLRVVFIAVAVFLSGWTKVQAQSVSAVISRMGDTTHLEFRGQKEWNYISPNKTKEGIVFTVPAFDEKTLMALQSWSCPLIKNITVDKNAPDGKYEVTVHTARNDVTGFDYLTDDPSYLVIDFYKEIHKVEEKKETETKVSKTPISQKKTGRRAIKLPEKKVASDEYARHDRAPAGSEMLSVTPTKDTDTASLDMYQKGVFDGADPNFDRFRIKDYEKDEKALIASQHNIYTHFPIFAQKLDRFNELLKVTPVYEVKEVEDEENKTVRLLLTLFNKKRWGAFFTTLKYLEEKFPKSKYEEIVKNMTAEAHIQIYARDHDAKDYEAYRSMYQYLVKKYPDSILTERNMLMLAYSSLDSGSGSEALQQIQLYLAKYPHAKETDFARLAEAEAYVLLNKPDDAIRVYSDLTKNYKDKKYAIEADYRIGDVHFIKKEYAQAVNHYKGVYKRYPKFKSEFASAQYNLAESEFWLGRHEESLNNYIDFLKLFPLSRQGGCALDRVAELLEIFGVSNEKIAGALMEAYFRYPESPGSEIARIRALSRNFKSMNVREEKRALEEINAIVKESKLPDMEEFATLKIADGFSQRKETERSLNLLLDYYHAHPVTANLPIIKTRIQSNISDIMKANIDEKKYIDALTHYGKYSTTWLKNNTRLDIPYQRAVAFEKAGAFKEAKGIYLNLLKTLQKMNGTKADRERAVYEHPLHADQVRLRLASTELDEKNYRSAFAYLNAIREPLTEDEEIEKIQMGAVVSEQMGNVPAAIKYLDMLVKKSAGNVAQVVHPVLELSRLYLQGGKTQAADEQLVKIEKLKEAGAQISDEDWAKAIELRGDLQLKNGESLAAVESYTKLLDGYEHKYPLNSIRYRAGKILFDMGDLKGAEKIWQDLKSGTGEIYKKIAMEKLSQATWHDSYKKYIDRIPAAEGLK